jgi:hypothetical protein
MLRPENRFSALGLEIPLSASSHGRAVTDPGLRVIKLLTQGTTTVPRFRARIPTHRPLGADNHSLWG